MNEDMEKICGGLEYALSVLDSLPVRGAVQCGRVVTALRNLETITQMMRNGRLMLCEGKGETERDR